MAGYSPRAIEGVDDTSNQSIPTTTETTVLTVSKVSTPGPNASVVITGCCNITPGVGTTLVVITGYRGSAATGVELGTSLGQNVTAGDEYTIPFAFTDSPGDASDQDYTITIRQLNATGNGSCAYVTASGVIS